MKSGHGLIPEELKELPRISPSKLVCFLNSPAEYKDRYIDKQDRTTPAMLEGRMLHMYILEPQIFWNHYSRPLNKSEHLVTVEDLQNEIIRIIGYKGKGKKEDLVQTVLNINPSAKIYDVEIARLERENKVVLTMGQMEMLKMISDRIYDNKFISWILKDGLREQLMWYVEPDLNVLITFKPDFFTTTLAEKKQPLVVDLKRLPSCNPYRMRAWLDNSKVHVQMAMYADGIKMCYGVEPSTMILGVEQRAPYITESYVLDQAAIEVGRNLYKKGIVEYLECVKTNNWYGFSKQQEPILLSLPSWALQRDFIGEAEVVHE